MLTTSESLLNPVTNSPTTPATRPALWWFESTPVLLLLLAVWLAATAWIRPLMLPDEGRYGEVARAMFMNSSASSPESALIPKLNGLPFFHKPPLFYWLDMLAMTVFGSHEFAARAGSLVGAWVMGGSLFVFMRRTHGLALARVALGVLATTPFFFCGAQYANHDMLVGGLITAAILALVRALDGGSRTSAPLHLGWLVAGWVFCALALLSKGLIGVVLPALTLGPWLLAQGRWRQMLKLLHPLGLLAFVAVAAPWFVAMQRQYPEFLDYFFMEQHFRRYAQSHFNNVQGFWFFWVVVPCLTLPWAAWLPTAVQRLKLNATVGLYAWWAVVVIGFFSAPSSKLIGYALPAVAPWCALLALAVARRGTHVNLKTLWPWVMGISAVLCVAVVMVFAWKAPKSSQDLAETLAKRMAPTDKVVMVDTYVFDVPFYAKLQHPVIVASNWADPELPRQDNWRKELFDAARFDPAQGRKLLQPLTTMNQMACNASAVWFIVPGVNSDRVAGLTAVNKVFANDRYELWHAAGRSCT
jgi:4-amino-4-deoxy-L-arabinose transferase-like glycosyltransferase